MKKTLLLFFTITSLKLFSQTLTVGTDSPQHLADKIVNTKCITTSNWVVSSGSNFGQGNSVGTFTKQPGANFPFWKGIVLSTGNIDNIPGPKTLPEYIGDGNNAAWASDNDMNSIVGSSNFTNASSLQFEFTSQKTNFKLDYIFASEEYGQRQCNVLSDVVVILLTDMVTGVTTNVATTPSNQLISPINIRRNTFNTSCSDENANLFSAYYGGTNASTSPIDMFGHTVAMTAQATIQTGHPYKLKIIIADRFDYQFDSAIFIKDFTPDIDQINVLGNDLKLCQGTPLTLSVPYSSSQYQFVWRKNGSSIPNTNFPTYTIPASDMNGITTYNVTIIPLFCEDSESYGDTIIVEYVDQIITANPVDLNRCVGDTSPYDLSQNTAIISNGLSFTPTITYHSSLADANNGINPLPTSYNGTLTTILVRIVQPNSPCPPLIKQFNLGTSSSPTNIGTPSDVTLCARTPFVSNATLNFNTITTTVLNGQSPTTYGVSFHTSQVGANTNTNIFSIPNGGNATVVTSTIYIRLYVIGSQNCYTTTSFNILVKPLLAADEQQPVVYCGTPGYTLPPLTNGKYFTNAYDGISLSSQLPEIPAGTVISIPPGHVGTYNHPTIYVSNLVTTANDCTQQWPLNITLIQPSSFTENSTTSCDTYSLPDLPHGDFWSGPNGTGTMYPAGTEITTTTTLYYNFQSEINTVLNPVCNVPAGPITITIENKPDLGPDRPNVFTCEPPYFLPSLAAYPGAKYYDNPNGTGTAIPDGTAVNATDDFYVYLEDTTGTLNCPAVDHFKIIVGLDPIATINQCNYILPEPAIGTYWDGQHLADGSCNGCTQLFAGDYVEQSMTIYLYVAPPVGETCTTGQNQISFQVNVTQPLVDDIPGFITPHCGNFKLPTIANGKYYTESHLNGGTGGTELLPGYVVDTNQIIYVYNVNVGSVPLCEFEKSFNFIINPLPPLQVDYRLDVDLCSGDFSSGELPHYDLTPPTFGSIYTLPNGGGNLIISPTDTEDVRIDGPFPKELYFYNIFPDTGCKNESIIRITYSETTADDVPSIIPIEVGQSYSLPDLTVSNSRYHDNYWNPTDPNDPQNVSTTPPNVIPNPSVWSMPDPTQDFFDQTLYVYNASLDGVREICPVNKPFRIVLYRQPNIFGNPNVIEMPNIYSCGNSPVVLPSLTGNQKYYKESHLSGGTVFTEITGPITESTRVYVYEEIKSIIPGSTFKIYDEEYFEVVIFKVDTGSDITSCGSITLPTLTSGNYYYGTNGTNPITNNVINYSATETYPKTIYIFGTSGFPSGKCQNDENSFTITIIPIPTINPIPLYDANPLVIDRTYCDTDNTNDGILNIDLTQYNSTLLGTQTGSEFSVTYHNSLDDALNNLNPITESLSNNPSLYAVVRNSNFTSCSSTSMKIDFVVNMLPEPNPEDVYLCINNITGLPISGEIIDSGLLTGNYIFDWKDSTGATVGSSNIFVANAVGEYTLTVTDIDPTKGCVSLVKTVSALPSSIAITGYTVTQDFDDNQTITVIPDGYGDNYIYQIDGGLFQESNIFTNVSSGNHEIVIRDKNGCGDSTPIYVLVLKYPKFFTPNSDGYNDLWNIYDLNELGDPNAKISIFDRQGKLLKQISPAGLGWDGNHNGNQMIADDYWFVVNYKKDGISREFKAHFSLKR